jgi:hypothetical protein
MVEPVYLAAFVDTGNFSSKLSRPALINSNVMYKVISFDIDAGGNGKSELLDRRIVPEV